MNRPNRQTDIKDITEETGAVPDTGHDVWVRERIEAGLKAKREGKLTYTSLEEIKAKFGLDAS